MESAAGHTHGIAPKRGGSIGRIVNVCDGGPARRSLRCIHMSPNGWYNDHSEEAAVNRFPGSSNCSAGPGPCDQIA